MVGVVIRVAVAADGTGCVGLVDSELGPSVGDVVIREHPGRSERGADVISGRTGILTGNTSVGRRYSIGEQEARSTARSQPSRLGIAISFAVGIGRPGRVALVDRLQDVAVARKED